LRRAPNQLPRTPPPPIHAPPPLHAPPPMPPPLFHAPQYPGGQSGSAPSAATTAGTPTATTEEHVLLRALEVC
jgi:hypothetical protein